MLTYQVEKQNILRIISQFFLILSFLHILFLKVLLLYVWLHWVFVAVFWLSLVGVNEGSSLVAGRGLLLVVAFLVLERGL